MLGDTASQKKSTSSGYGRTRSPAARAGTASSPEGRGAWQSGHIVAHRQSGDDPDFSRAHAGDDRARGGGDVRRAARLAATGDCRRCCATPSSITPPAMTMALAGISIPNFWLGSAPCDCLRRGARMVAGVGSRIVAAPGAAGDFTRRGTRRDSCPDDPRDVTPELREQYVVAARARGASTARVVLRHAFRNSRRTRSSPCLVCSSGRC